ncbi:MAG: BNR-4 repeat-containing protein [Victivallales bacterium]|nr:BNR-4 repeat-containing protein [Victivallales bacterium]
MHCVKKFISAMQGISFLVIICSVVLVADKSFARERQGVSFPANHFAMVKDWENIRLQQFTVAAWINAEKINGARTIVNVGETPQFFTFYIFKNKMRMLVEERPCITKYIESQVKTNTWEHFTGIFDGQKVSLYRNGKIIGSTPVNGMISGNGNPLFIGAEYPGSKYFAGKLDDVAIWNTVLGENEIKKLNKGESPSNISRENLVALWNSDSFDLPGKVWRNVLANTLNAKIMSACSTVPRNAKENPENFIATAKATYIGEKFDGYRGIWYAIQPISNKYVYKYSGGMATYTAKHRPMAVYAPAVNKTFFVYGGADFSNNRKLIHMVGCYDHNNDTVTKPTALLDKQTSDAHDNPVIALDDRGFIWIFSTSHGRERFSYIYKSDEPFNIDRFTLVRATKTKDNSIQTEPLYNFSYFQPWHVPGKGFICFFTYYGKGRQIFYMTSKDGMSWSEWKSIAYIKQGDYQVSLANTAKAATSFNYHPDTTGKAGVDYRTNLYYVQTRDFGKTWETAGGIPVTLPLTDVKNPALVFDYEKEGLLVYMKDIRFDENNNPVILYITSKGFASGPENNPRTWTTARWTGHNWEINPAMTSDNNYDTGSLYLEKDGTWRIIAPTQPGPQDYNPGGEMAMWTSHDKGKNWQMDKQLTYQSKLNHSYARRPIDPNDGFYAFWADGHGREASDSSLYFCDKQGNVRILPRTMISNTAKPEIYMKKGIGNKL